MGQAAAKHLIIGMGFHTVALRIAWHSGEPRWGAILAIWVSRALQNGQRGGSLLRAGGVRYDRVQDRGGSGLLGTPCAPRHLAIRSVAREQDPWAAREEASAG